MKSRKDQPHAEPDIGEPDRTARAKQSAIMRTLNSEATFADYGRNSSAPIRFEDVAYEIPFTEAETLYQISENRGWIQQELPTGADPMGRPTQGTRGQGARVQPSSPGD